MYNHIQALFDVEALFLHYLNYTNYHRWADCSSLRATLLHSFPSWGVFWPGVSFGFVWFSVQFGHYNLLPVPNMNIAALSTAQPFVSLICSALSLHAAPEIVYSFGSRQKVQTCKAPRVALLSPYQWCSKYSWMLPQVWLPALRNTRFQETYQNLPFCCGKTLGRANGSKHKHSAQMYHLLRVYIHTTTTTAQQQLV